MELVLQSKIVLLFPNTSIGNLTTRCPLISMNTIHRDGRDLMLLRVAFTKRYFFHL